MVVVKLGVFLFIGEAIRAEKGGYEGREKDRQEIGKRIIKS